MEFEISLNHLLAAALIVGLSVAIHPISGTVYAQGLLITNKLRSMSSGLGIILRNPALATSYALA